MIPVNGASPTGLGTHPPSFEGWGVSLAMASIWRRLPVTRYFICSFTRGRKRRIKLGEVVPCKDTIHILVMATKLVASLFHIPPKIHSVSLDKNHFHAVKPVGLINCKNITVDDLQQYALYFYVLWSISIVFFQKFHVWFSSSGIPYGSVYVLLLTELGKLR